MSEQVESNDKKGLGDFVKLSDHTFCEENLHLYVPTPFYQEYNAPGIYDEDIEEDSDIKYFKGLYPDSAAQIMEHIEEECDKMEYEGSRMFDEHPDRWMIREIEEKIYEKVQHLDESSKAAEVSATYYNDRYRRPPHERWLGDMVHVLLYDEMFRRRCRHRRCRRRFY